MNPMNPYNFVRIRPLGENTRQKPLGHKTLHTQHNGQPVYTGRLHLRLTNFSPFIILSHFPGDFTEINKHKTYKRFFHYPNDLRPVIPASSLKGMVRAIAEAASNSCLSILNEEYVKRWPEFDKAFPPNLRYCGSFQSEKLCPTCRLFGMAQEKESGTSQTGARPNAFQGKVRFSDAIFEGDFSNIYAQPAQLIILSTPKLSQNVWYHDPGRNDNAFPLAGRKFYYHHDNLEPKTDNTRNRLDQRATVHPLKPGTTFTFTINFRNLLESELDLLLYALELEPAENLVEVRNNDIFFDWSNVKKHKGIYPKLGYGKPAGLGSINILTTQLHLLNPTTRYTNGNSWDKQLSGQALRDFIQNAKHNLIPSSHPLTIKPDQEGIPTNLSDLRNILRFPNRIPHFKYPAFNKFKSYKRNNTKLPIPGRENQNPKSKI